jgi:hypothetical protein
MAVGVVEAGIKILQVKALGEEVFVDFPKMRLVFVHGLERTFGVNPDDFGKGLRRSLQGAKLLALDIELEKIPW